MSIRSSVPLLKQELCRRLPCLYHLHVPLYQRASLNPSHLKPFWQDVLQRTESRERLRYRVCVCVGLPVGCLNKLARLLISFLFSSLFEQSLLHFENSDMGWGAAHTQECRWVETGSDTHAREVSFHPLAVVRWGGSTPNQRGGNLTPSQTATCTAFQLIQPQFFFFF